ncbi:hypothetical protein [Thauera propionica]|uniref:hypothetical protein n=1 Tax=Thauera propionica TaxID=2019431 RepID=UPI0023EFA737|nr:hypothetical protein [Thauera propionica]MDD3676055.1 hypothetical protein [Thauera propionica]
MIKLDLTADVAKATEHLSELAQRHVPNAAAKALTRTAFDARDAVRDGLPERFTLRRPWVSRGIGVTPAKPRTLMAEVWSRDRFMAAQETGGSHPDARPIPAGRLREMAQTRVIPKSQWLDRVKNKPNVFYRAGMLFERRDERRILALYLLRPKTQIKVRPRLGMSETVRSVALRDYQRQMERALREELAKA